MGTHSDSHCDLTAQGIPVGVYLAAQKIARASRDWNNEDAVHAIVDIIMAETHIGTLIDALKRERDLWVAPVRPDAVLTPLSISRFLNTLLRTVGEPTVPCPVSAGDASRDAVFSTMGER